MPIEDPYPDFGPDPLHGLTREQRLARAAEDRKARIVADLENLERDTPIRSAFHQYLKDNGWNIHHQGTPAPGAVYPSSHTQNLWLCFLAATLAERERLQYVRNSFPHE
jgi:hypothetical protein